MSRLHYPRRAGGYAWIELRNSISRLGHANAPTAPSAHSPHRHEQLLPELLPLRRLVEPLDRIDHAELVFGEQRRLRLARGVAIEIIEHLLAVWRQHEINKQHRRVRMR